MKFRDFFNTSRFTLFATSNSNWDLYSMQYKDTPPSLVALAKDGTGAADCFFGNMTYLESLERKGINHGYTKVS